jgi:hypothetical protein
LGPLSHIPSFSPSSARGEVETETLFFADDHEPPLGHEYQFDLDTDPGQRFLERVLAFLRQRLAAPPQRVGSSRNGFVAVARVQRPARVDLR